MLGRTRLDSGASDAREIEFPPERVGSRQLGMTKSAAAAKISYHLPCTCQQEICPISGDYW